MTRNLGAETVQKVPDLDVIDEAIGSSIRSHTVSDVGYTVQLSGGVDSSLVTAILSESQRESLRTFSVCRVRRGEVERV